MTTLGQRGLPTVERPFPYDLRRDLPADRDGIEPMLSDTPVAAEGRRAGTSEATAAGDGRGEQ